MIVRIRKTRFVIRFLRAMFFFFIWMSVLNTNLIPDGLDKAIYMVLGVVLTFVSSLVSALLSMYINRLVFPQDYANITIRKTHDKIE